MFEPKTASPATQLRRYRTTSRSLTVRLPVVAATCGGSMPGPAGFDVNVLFAELDKRRDLQGARVVYFDGARMNVLRSGPPICQSGLLAVVLRKGGRELVPTSSEIAQARDKKFNAELLNLGLSCGGALIAWGITVTAAGAAPVTGGTSLIIAKFSTVAGWVGTAQCVNAGFRMWNETTHPERNDWLDDQQWYTATMTAMDGIGLAASVVSGAATIRMVQLARQGTGKSLMTVLKGLSRQERKKLTEEIIRAHNPRVSGQEMKVLISRGIFPKRYHNKEISKGILRQLTDAVNSTLGVVGSATGGIIGQAMSSEPRDDVLFGILDSYETY